METRKFINNYQFYSGYEGEYESIFKIKNHESLNLHIWYGYISKILNNPIFGIESNWIGFTRDYNEFIGVFGDTPYEVSPSMVDE